MHNMTTYTVRTVALGHVDVERESNNHVEIDEIDTPSE